MSTFKKLAGVGMSALLAASVFLSGNFTSVSTLDAVAEEGDSVQEQTTQTQPTQTTQTQPTNTQSPKAQSEEMAAYLFVHFVGSEANEDQEQIYFSVSQNGTSWQTLNNKQPVLTSDLGTKGVRDPHIVRSPNGDKFYLIATDLSIYGLRDLGNGKWGYSQTDGSKSIVIWESEDLVNWSAPRLRQIAREDAGCAWAPESIWDNERNAYMVFWASKTQDSWTHRIYRCYTTDFDTFTEPEIYIESDVSWIDTTFIEHDGVYYRFTKNEDKTYVFLEKSTSLSGDFELVSTYTLNGNPASQMTGYEGPTAYKLNGQDKWCLLLDNYGTSSGYKPFVTEDISKGNFTSGTAFNFNGTTFRHGTVMPITQSEYDALVARKWPVYDGPAETGELVFELNFNDGDLTQSTGNATVTSNGVTFGTEDGRKAVKFENNKFISITGANSPIKGLTSCTVSFSAKVQRTDTSWWFFAAPNTDEQSWQTHMEQYIGAFSKSGTLHCERYHCQGNSRSPEVAGTYTQDNWMHVTLVYRTDKTILYINGERVAKVNSSVDLAEMLGSSPVIQLGKANYGTGEFALGWLDDFRIHNYALSEDEVLSNYNAVKGVS